MVIQDIAQACQNIISFKSYYLIMFNQFLLFQFLVETRIFNYYQYTYQYSCNTYYMTTANTPSSVLVTYLLTIPNWLEVQHAHTLDANPKLDLLMVSLLSSLCLMFRLLNILPCINNLLLSNKEYKREIIFLSLFYFIIRV